MFLLTNRIFTRLFAGLVCVIFSTQSELLGAAEKPVRPNIVFIFADDWGWGDLSCHGSKTFKTPNLDKLAAQGTDFHRFTVASGVCSPSRTAIMTGHYPTRYSIHQHFATIAHHRKCGMPDWLPPEGVMLPRLLKDAGYATAHFGKWHLTNEMIPDAPIPKEYGYDESAVFNGPGPQTNANPTIDKPTSTDMAIDFIRRHRDQPFFINLWVHATHTPHYPTKQWLEEFKAVSQPQRTYAAVVAEADERIGQVIATVDELKLTDRTLIVFSSDNGPESSGKKKEQGDAATGAGLGTYYSVGSTGGLRGRKRSLFLGGVGVPFIVRWPGVTTAGKVDHDNVITAVDMLPTFCAAAGVDLPDGYVSDRQDVTMALRGELMTRQKPIFWEWRGTAHGENWPRLGVSDGRWPLLLGEGNQRIQLFDVTEDREQSKNLAQEQRDVTKRLTTAVLAWKKSLPDSPPNDAFSRLRKSN